MRTHLRYLLAGTTILLASLAPGVARAHPGHGDPGLTGSLLHAVLEPVHAPALLLVAAASGWALSHLARRVRRVLRAG